MWRKEDICFGSTDKTGKFSYDNNHMCRLVCRQASIYILNLNSKLWLLRHFERQRPITYLTLSNSLHFLFQLYSINPYKNAFKVSTKQQFLLLRSLKRIDFLRDKKYFRHFWSLKDTFPYISHCFHATFLKCLSMHLHPKIQLKKYRYLEQYNSLFQLLRRCRII